eukprot:scaffold18841_cov83-Cyclotella_meneghiniana.AAC.15
MGEVKWSGRGAANLVATRDTRGPVMLGHERTQQSSPVTCFLAVLRVIHWHLIGVYKYTLEFAEFVETFCYSSYRGTEWQNLLAFLRTLFFAQKFQLASRGSSYHEHH